MCGTRKVLTVSTQEQVFAEFWISLASLLRSYTALHGLSGNRQAAIEQDEERILARHGEQGLELRRNGSTVSWKRTDGRSGTLELTEAGTLRSIDPRSQNRDLGHPDEEEMDMAAEAWAREIMQ
jgi:hypothetical protein